MLQKTSSNAQDVQLLRWLSLTVQEAVTTAERHEQLKLRIRKLRGDVEAAFRLSSVQAGSEYSASIQDQERQMESITVLNQTLTSLTTSSEGPSLNIEELEGCQFRLYHPNDTDTVKSDSSKMDEYGNLTFSTDYAPPYIDPSGTIHLVAVKSDLGKHLSELDYGRARTLSKVSYYWVRRMRQLAEPIADLLRVRSVWCEQSMNGALDMNEGNQRFVLWAGNVLEKKMEIERALEGRRYSFSIIVNPCAASSDNSPPLSFHPSSPILYVSTDCHVSELVQFLSSEAGGLASVQARDAHEQRAVDETILEEVRVALGAKCVIKICMAEGVMEGARRLRDNAEIIRGELGSDLLKGACIAIDDCYELWDSGFISIPWNFRADELPGMIKMLQSGQAPAAPTSSSPTPTPSPTSSPTSIRSLPGPRCEGNHLRMGRTIPQRPVLPCPCISRQQISLSKSRGLRSLSYRI